MFIFLILAKSEWWDFNPDEYDDYEENSYKHPIFAVLTFPRCVLCKGMPEMLHKYSDMVGEASKVVFTNINCKNSSVCDRIKIHSFPTFVLIRGNDPKYWIQTYDRTYMAWNKFLESNINAKSVEIKKLDLLAEEIAKTDRGSTTFYLSVPENSQEILKAYKRLIPYYHPIGNRFIYHIGGSNIQISAHKSSKCAITKEISKVDEMKEFIESNKFSSFHNFGYLELQNLIRKNTSVFITVGEDSLDENQVLVLDKLSSEYCGKVELGWAGKNINSDIISFTRKNPDDVPYSFVINPTRNCYHLQTGQLSKENANKIIRNNMNGIECMNVPSTVVGIWQRITETIGWYIKKY